MQPHVVFIDDEIFWARGYVDALSERFRVSAIQDAVNAISFVNEHDDIDAIVVDVMMPTPAGVAPEDVEDGLTTGIWLIKQLGPYIKRNRIPVFVLTNRAGDTVQEAIDALDFPEGLVTVHRKIDTPRKKSKGTLHVCGGALFIGRFRSTGFLNTWKTRPEFEN